MFMQFVFCWRYYATINTCVCLHQGDIFCLEITPAIIQEYGLNLIGMFHEDDLLRTSYNMWCRF